MIDGAKWDAVQAQLASNHHANLTRTNVKSKSLLAGLIFDEAGNRLVSSHTTRNGKRYRYYITSTPTGRAVTSANAARLRLPAAMIDGLVRAQLQSFLADKTQISRLLRQARCRPVEIGNGLAVAGERAASLASGSTLAQTVADVLARVTVSAKHLKVSIKRSRLLALLTDRSSNSDDDQDELMPLEVLVPATPGGGADKLVFEDQDAGIQDAVVIKAIARASVWFEQLTTGKAQSMAEIAVGEGLTDNYVSNLIHLAWLSPAMVERVLEAEPAATALARSAMLTRKSDVFWRPGGAQGDPRRL